MLVGDVVRVHIEGATLHAHTIVVVVRPSVRRLGYCLHCEHYFAGVFGAFLTSSCCLLWLLGARGWPVFGIQAGDWAATSHYFTLHTCTFCGSQVLVAFLFLFCFKWVQINGQRLRNLNLIVDLKFCSRMRASKNFLVKPQFIVLRQSTIE